MFCKKCGKEIEDNLKSCPYCSTVFEEENNPKDKLVLDKKKVMIIGGLCVAVIALAVVFLAAFNAGKKSAEASAAADTSVLSTTAAETTTTTSAPTTTTTTTTKTTTTKKKTTTTEKPKITTYTGTDIPNYNYLTGDTEEIVPSDVVIFKHYTIDTNYKKYLDALRQCGFYAVDSESYSNGKNTVNVHTEYEDSGSFCVYISSEDLWDYFRQKYQY